MLSHRIKCIGIWVTFWFKDVTDIIRNKNMNKQQGFICSKCGIHYPN